MGTHLFLASSGRRGLKAELRGGPFNQGGPDGHHHRRSRQRADDRAAAIRTDHNIRQEPVADDLAALAQSINQPAPADHAGERRPVEEGGDVLIAWAFTSLAEPDVRAAPRRAARGPQP